MLTLSRRRLVAGTFPWFLGRPPAEPEPDPAPEPIVMRYEHAGYVQEFRFWTPGEEHPADARPTQREGYSVSLSYYPTEETRACWAGLASKGHITLDDRGYPLSLDDHLARRKAVTS